MSINESEFYKKVIINTTENFLGATRKNSEDDYTTGLCHSKTLTEEVGIAGSLLGQL